MKRKIWKKLVCCSGLLFMTFPAWSAVPSNLLPGDGSWNQAPAVSDVENALFENGMILARGGGGGGGGGGAGGGAGSGGGQFPSINGPFPCNFGVNRRNQLVRRTIEYASAQCR
jgi:hypothetical protein